MAGKTKPYGKDIHKLFIKYMPVPQVVLISTIDNKLTAPSLSFTSFPPLNSHSISYVLHMHSCTGASICFISLSTPLNANLSIKRNIGGIYPHWQPHSNWELLVCWRDERITAQVPPQGGVEGDIAMLMIQSCQIRELLEDMKRDTWKYNHSSP